MRKKTLISSIFLVPTLGLFCAVSCQKKQPQPVLVDINFSADVQNMFGYSNDNFEGCGFVSYKIDIEGTFEDGDILEIDAINQVVGSKPGSYVSIKPESKKIYVNSDTKNFEVLVQKLDSAGEQVYLANFDLRIGILRNSYMVYRQVIPNFKFCKATPTFSEMFVKGGDALIGWDTTQPWVEYQSSLCDMFLPPQEIKTISSNAFFSQPDSLLPDLMQVLDLDISNDYWQQESQLIEINANAFRNAPVKKIILPSTLQLVQTGAFADGKQLNTIDLSKIQSIPDMWQSNLFSGVQPDAEHSKVIVNSEEMIEPWKEYFRDNEQESNIADWNFEVSGNK